jgi:hypothetical protein
MIATLLILAACSDYTIDKRTDGDGGGPAIEATPNPMLFGELPAADRAEQVLRINSVGSASLNLTAMTVSEGDTWFQVTIPDGTFASYEPETGTEVVVTYTSDGNPVTGKLSILSNDASSPTTVVDLIGGSAVPDLVIDPENVNFGAVSVGESAEERVTLSNIGDAPLTVTSIATTDPVFEYAMAGALPLTIPAGGSETVTVAYTPVESAVSTGFLQVESNDPNGMEQAALNGSAGGQPVAVCYADPDVIEAIHETTDWIGSGSYDPAGYAITSYDWRLVSTPAGSSAIMPGGGANRRGFTPDVVGTYEAQLVVTNELGERSEPCIATLEAEPFGGLWIEMFWTNSGDDMDLHLVNPGGSAEARLTTDDDCYYANCTGGWGAVDWGRTGDTSDDPALDLDDIPGTGPENINILSPASGVYTVFVHDYPGSVYEGRNNVTVNIYVGGVLEWTDTRNVNSEDYYAPFAEISWPSGTVTSL